MKSSLAVLLVLVALMGFVVDAVAGTYWVICWTPRTVNQDKFGKYTCNQCWSRFYEYLPGTFPVETCKYFLFLHEAEEFYRQTCDCDEYLR
jgi:hypothetical protein